jgi:hypothetical protein
MRIPIKFLLMLFLITLFARAQNATNPKEEFTVRVTKVERADNLVLHFPSVAQPLASSAGYKVEAESPTVRLKLHCVIAPDPEQNSCEALHANKTYDAGEGPWPGFVHLGEIGVEGSVFEVDSEESVPERPEQWLALFRMDEAGLQLRDASRIPDKNFEGKADFLSQLKAVWVRSRDVYCARYHGAKYTDLDGHDQECKK